MHVQLPMPVFLTIAWVAVLLVVGVPLYVLVSASRGAKRLPQVVTVVAWLVVAGAVGATGWASVGYLTLDQLEVTVPVSQAPVRLDPAVILERMYPTQIVRGGYDQVSVVATGLSLNARLLLLVSGVLSAATVVGVAIIILRLARATGAGDPFRVGRKALAAAAWIIFIGGSAAELMGRYAAHVIAQELFFVNGWTATSNMNPEFDPSQAGWPGVGGLNLGLPMWAVGTAVGLGLIAAVFRHGERLRRDAEGLV